MVCIFSTIDSGITYCQDAHRHKIQIFIFQSAANVAHRDIIVIDLAGLVWCWRLVNGGRKERTELAEVFDLWC